MEREKGEGENKECKEMEKGEGKKGGQVQEDIGRGEEGERKGRKRRGGRFFFAMKTE